MTPLESCPHQADRDILEHIVYDFGDTAMMEALRPSIEEAFPIQSQVGAGAYTPAAGRAVGPWRTSVCACVCVCISPAGPLPLGRA